MEKKELTVTERIAQLKKKYEPSHIAHEKLSNDFAETKAAIRRDEASFNRDMRELARTNYRRPTTPQIPNLDEKIAATRARLQRIDELAKSQRQILDEIHANPWEEKCDAVLADVGRELYMIDQDEIRDAEDAANFLETEDRSDEADEVLERAGKPPPLRKV